jgi:hypothetical protein
VGAETKIHSRGSHRLATYANRAVSYPEAVRLFQKGDIWNLRAAELRRLGMTHAYAGGVFPRAHRDACASSLTRSSTANPFINEPFAEPPVLYRVIDDCPASASH